MQTEPPIDEVVVGFRFDPVASLDPIEAGMYLAARRDRYKSYEMKAPLLAAGWEDQFSPERPPYRAWLMPEREEWLVQVQSDRLDANWRRRPNSTYPGFADEVLPFAMAAVEDVATFCGTLRRRPTVSAVELTKINILYHGKDWADETDLERLVPAIAALRGAVGSTSRHLGFTWNDQLAVGEGLVLTGALAQLKEPMNGLAYRLELRWGAPVAADMRDQLLRANTMLTNMFRQTVSQKPRENLA